MPTLARLAAGGACALAAALVATAAPAEPGNIQVTGQNHARLTRTAAVTVGDLDLRTAAGQDRFRTRVAAAADEVCADVGAWYAFERRDRVQCRSRAIEGAVAQAYNGTAVGVE